MLNPRVKEDVWAVQAEVRDEVKDKVVAWGNARDKVREVVRVRGKDNLNFFYRCIFKMEINSNYNSLNL
jgi:hypothetical protein